MGFCGPARTDRCGRNVLLISRFQVRVLGGSLLNFLQMPGKWRNLEAYTRALDTSLTLTDSSSQRWEATLGGYRARCDEAWLVVAAVGGPSSRERVSDEVFCHHFRSAFDRVVLISPRADPDRRVLVLV
jgi:hypothetical protein